MRRHLTITALLLLATVGVFSRVLQADFVAWDDDTSVYRNPSIQALDAQRLVWMFTNVSYSLRYKPLCWLSYAVIYAWAGLTPLAYHLANLVFHCLNGVLSYYLIRELVMLGRGPKAETEKEQATLAWCAGVGALVWAVHPLRTEAVARVTDLTYTESLFFLLISAWCYLRANSRPQAASSGRALYWASVVAFALSMLSYPLAFGYAVVLIVLDLYPLGRFRRTSHWRRDAVARRIWVEKVPFVLLGGLVLVTFAGRLSPSGTWAPLQDRPGLSALGIAMQAAYIWAYYLWKPLAPLHLSPVYTTLVSFNPLDIPFMTSAGLLVGLTALLVWRRQQWPWALALWVCHLVLLAPALGLTEHPHYASDRYSYFPSLLWSVLLAATLMHLRPRPRAFACGLVASLAAAGILGAMSFHQTRIWRDSPTLFGYMIGNLGNEPYRSGIYCKSARYWREKGLVEMAVADYKRALDILPDLPEAHDELATILIQQHDTPGALQHWRRVLKTRPDDVVVLNNMAWVLATHPNPQLRDGDQAVQLAERACALAAPPAAANFDTLAAGYAETGRFDEAVKAMTRAVAVAAAAGQTGSLAKFHSRLELYRRRHPYHAPE